MLLTDKYADLIYGTITCYDRMIIQGYIPGWSHAEGDFLFTAEEEEGKPPGNLGAQSANQYGN